MRVSHKKALAFMGTVQRVVSPCPDPDKLVELLDMADDVHLWLACKAEELKGVVSTEDYAKKLLWLMTCDVGAGVAVLPDRGLAVVVHAPAAGDVPESYSLITVPGWDEACAHAQKIKVNRTKGNGDEAAQATPA